MRENLPGLAKTPLVLYKIPLSQNPYPERISKELTRKTPSVFTRNFPGFLSGKYLEKIQEFSSCTGFYYASFLHQQLVHFNLKPF